MHEIQGTKKIVVSGSPSFQNLELLEAVLNEEKPDVIISGGLHTGAEDMAREYARKHGIKRLSFPKRNQKNSRHEYDRRNAFMFETTKPHLVIAFPGGTETHQVVKMAREHNCPVRTVAV